MPKKFPVKVSVVRPLDENRSEFVKNYKEINAEEKTSLDKVGMQSATATAEPN